MKRFRLLSILLALVMTLCLALTACRGGQGGSTEDGSDSGSTTEQGSDSGSTTPSEGETGGETTKSGSVLVAYFSAQNHTRTIAQYIAEATNADTFEITPVAPYTSADLRWTDSSSRVVQEHNDESRNVELTTTQVENWEDYETVFIGYPIWWQEASWVVDNFVKDNDFTGKTVIPFCTSSSSGLGKSGELLAEMAGTGDWKEGKRFSSSASKSDVEEWIALE